MSHKEPRDVVIVGAGHNGLVTAAYLAKAGLRPLVLERREMVGGAAVTETFHPGFSGPAVTHAAAPLAGRVAKDLELDRQGLEWLKPSVRVFSPAPDGRFLALYDDAAKTAEGLKALSPRDAESYPAFAGCFARIGAALAPLISMTPPSTDAPTARDLWALMGLGRKVRALPKRDVHRLLRWGPMAVADLVAEWFETELLRATIAARGIHAAFAGPWSAGTSAALLLQAAHDGHATAPAAFARGSMGAVSNALAQAARTYGAEIRTGTGVARILVEGGVAKGVVLESGEEIRAGAVVSSADPRRTFLSLVDGSYLGPDFVGKMTNYRSTGTVAKVNLALSALPRFTSLDRLGPDGQRLLTGRIHVGPDIDYMEKAFDCAKYGEPSDEPVLDVTIPTLLDPALAPAGAHVVSILAQFAPYHLKSSTASPGEDSGGAGAGASLGERSPRSTAGDWESRREELGDRIVATLAKVAPNLPELVVGRQVLTPVDLEQRYGLTGGHLLHGEAAPDQLFAFRPLIGYARYRSPIARLYMCGAGTHPGGGIHGASGANASREILRELRS